MKGNYQELIKFACAWQGNYLWQSRCIKLQRQVFGVTGRFFWTHRVMDPWMFIMARLLLELATRQGNTNVSVFSPDGDWKDIRFANFLSRKITTRIITRHGMDKQKLTKSQVQVTSWAKIIVLRKYVVWEMSYWVSFNFLAVVLLPTHVGLHFTPIRRCEIERHLAHSLFMPASSHKYYTWGRFQCIFLQPWSKWLRDYPRTVQGPINWGNIFSTTFFALRRFSRMIPSPWDIHPRLTAKIWCRRTRTSGLLGLWPLLKAGPTWRGETWKCALCPSPWRQCQMMVEGPSMALASTISAP